MQQIHQYHSHLNTFFQMVAIFMSLIQSLILFCQKTHFRSHTSRSFNKSHFSNMWVCFDFLPSDQTLPLDFKEMCIQNVKLPFQCPQTQNLPFDSDIEFSQELMSISHSKDNALRMQLFCPLMTKVHLIRKGKN